MSNEANLRDRALQLAIDQSRGRNGDRTTDAVLDMAAAFAAFLAGDDGGSGDGDDGDDDESIGIQFTWLHDGEEITLPVLTRGDVLTMIDVMIDAVDATWPTPSVA